MPQFDKITFFNQLFWLLFFFSGFYLLLLHYFLPKLSSVLKARQKMVKFYLGGVADMSKECVAVQESVNNDCAISLGQKNSGVLLEGTLFFVQWIKEIFSPVFNITLKGGLNKAENHLYSQTTLLFFLLDLTVSDEFFSTLELDLFSDSDESFYSL